MTGVNDTHSKDTVQQVLENVRKKTGYVCNHTAKYARYEALTMLLMEIYKYSGMLGGALTFRSSAVPPSSR
jgi:hypothetical protein